jgi:hypothetical protein
VTVQYRAPIPPGVSATRVIAFVQGAFGMLSGLILVFGGSSIATASGLTGTNAGTIVVIIGALVLTISGLLIWGGLLLGSLSLKARIGVLIYEWLAVALGLLGLLHPGLGIVSLVLAGVAVYYLQFDAQTKAAFVAGPPARPASAPTLASPYPGAYVGPPPTGQGVQPAPPGDARPPAPPGAGVP